MSNSGSRWLLTAVIGIVSMVSASSAQDQIKGPPLPNVTHEFRYFMDGDTFSINCTVPYNGNPVALSWQIPTDIPTSTIHESTNKYTVVKNELYYNTLTVVNASAIHEARYNCVSSNTGDTKMGYKEKKYLSKPLLNLIMASKSNRISVNEGTNRIIRLRVIVESYPPMLDYKFLKDNKELQPKETPGGSTTSEKYTVQRKILGDLILSISNVSVTDSGNYTFVVSNKLLKKNLTYEVTVGAKPVVFFHPNGDKKYVTMNTRASLECVAIGYPTPVVTWQFAGKPVHLPELIKQESLYKLSSIVDISPSQSGNITCIAANNKGETLTSQAILVYEIPGGFGLPDGNSSWFSEGQDIEITCLASKYDFNNLTWKGHDGKDLSGMVKYSQNSLSHVAKIQIKRIPLDQNGAVYTCFGNSVTGSVWNESVTLTVAAQQPLIIEEPMDVKRDFYPSQTSIKLTCLAAGVPPPEVSWYKDDIELENNLTVNIITKVIDHTTVNSSLEITDMHALKGQYVCVAKSVGQEKRKVFTVHPFQALSKSYSQILIPIIAIIFILILLVLYLTCKVKKEKGRFKKELAAAGLLYFKEGVTRSLNPELGIDEQAELLPYDEKFEFPSEKLILGKQLGAGAFGVVYKAEARGIVNAEETTTVAVKMVKKTADNMYIKALASELKIMVYLGKHVNIVNLLGACTKNVVKRELSVIVEYCKFGNIHNYMQKHREVFIDQLTDNSEKSLGKINRGFSSSSASTGVHSDYCGSNVTQETDHTFLNTTNTCKSGRKVSEGYVQPEWRSNYETDYFEGRIPRPLTSRDLLCWAFQIARGMEYLASRKILHGDLAARNILLADDNVVKICDFGLARNIYNNDEYQKKENSPLPVKWLAVECMTDRIFSTQSDVWSFGIVLWEMFSLAKTPYPSIAPPNLLQWLSQGHRLEKPPYADDRLYDVMRKCWQEKPTMRPSFTQLQEILGSFLEDSVRNHYVDLNSLCMACNEKKEGQEDYLDMVCAPDYKNMVTPSPHHYVNEKERFFPPTPAKLDQDGYLQMSPAVSDSLFSPRTQAMKFDFDAQKYNSRTSEASSCGSELTPMLTLNNLPARSGSDSDHEGSVSPQINLCPPIEEETDEVFEKQNNAKNLQNNCIVQNTGITNLMYIKLDDVNREKKPNDITNHYINVPNGLVA